MIKPKAVKENDAVMSQEIKDEKMEVMRGYLWDDKISTEEANAAIDAFNAKWLAAGGLQSNCITRR